MDKILATPPPVLQNAVIWQLNQFLLPRLRFLAPFPVWLSLWDSFGTPGDTLLTGAVAHIIKEKFPHLRLNVLTPNPDLLKFNPAIDALNQKPGILVLRVWYLDIIEQKDGRTNLLAPTLSKLGIARFEYKNRFHLTTQELVEAQTRLAHLHRPIVTINTGSREKIKMWRNDRWLKVAAELARDFDLVHLGGCDELELPSATRLAGLLSMRESIAVLSLAKVHLGPVSFLMHAANGVGVPSVIVYGGRETPANSGYQQNINLYSNLGCSPCWLHDSRGDVCPHDMECMELISAEEVIQACRKLFDQVKPA